MCVEMFIYYYALILNIVYSEFSKNNKYSDLSDETMIYGARFAL